MSSCNPFSVFSHNSKHVTSYDIEFRAQTSDDTDVWRVAILSQNRKAKKNIISQELTKVLGTPIQPLDKQGRKHKRGVDGYVDLEWCFEDRETTNKSRFFVTSVHDPPYDAVLGRPDAERYGMLKLRY